MTAFDQAWSLLKEYYPDDISDEDYEEAEYAQNPQWPHKNWMESPQWPQLCDFVIEGLGYNGCGRVIDGDEVTGLPMMSGEAMCHDCLREVAGPPPRISVQGTANMEDDNWQDSIERGEPMNAFDRAWNLAKAPFRGTSSKYYDQAVKQGFIPARQVEKDRKGIWATNDFGMARGYSSTASRDEQPVVHHLPEIIEGVGEFDHYAPHYGYYPFDIPIEHSQEVWRGPSYEEWRRQRMQEIFDAMDANRFPTPKDPNITRYQNAMRESANAALRDFNNRRDGNDSL